MFRSARLQIILVFHHAQLIVSWKVSGSQGKSRCVMAKGGNRCWMHYRALRRHCLKIPHATMMDIATWAWEYFGKYSRNVSWNCIMQSRRHLLILRRNTAMLSGPEVIWDGLKDSENVFSGQHESTFQLLLGKTDIGFNVPKMKKTVQTVTNEKCKIQPLWWYGGASVPTAWVICIYVKVPLMQRLMLEFWRYICSHQDNKFSQELQQDNARPFFESVAGTNF